MSRQEKAMDGSEPQQASGAGPAARDLRAEAGAVLQVEKHDYTDLRPSGRAPAQGMAGFDPVYTDIVDYIIRCTHRIWDEKNVGLIYSHYAHNAVVYSALGTSYSREEVVRATLQRIAEYPERRGLGTQVIWGGNDVDGFYTSHLITSVGRFTAPGPYGMPTGKTFYSRAIADCMVFQNRIYREWLVRDNMAQLLNLGVDPDVVASKMAAEQAARGVVSPSLGDSMRLLGQEPPAERIDATIAATEQEAALLQMLHEIWNWRMFGRVREAYAPQAMWHGPRMRDLYGPAAVTQQLLGLLAMIPDAGWTPHHVCSVENSIEGGSKFAVRWTLEGHHTGWGVMGAPTGKPLLVMGMSQFHLKGGRIVEEYTLWDELALRVQLKLPPA